MARQKKLISAAKNSNPITITRKLFENLNTNTTSRNSINRTFGIGSEDDLKQMYNTTAPDGGYFISSDTGLPGPWGATANFYPQTNSLGNLISGFFSRHIYVEKGELNLTLSNQANTPGNIDAYWIEPRTNIPNVTANIMGFGVRDDMLGLLSSRVFELSWFNQISGVTGNNVETFRDHLENPQANIFDFAFFTHFYKVYKMRKYKLLPGKQIQLRVSKKYNKILNGTDVEYFTHLKHFSRFILIRSYGDLINDIDGNVGYSDYNLNISKEYKYKFYNLPLQKKPIQELNSATILPNDIWVINPISGFMEGEQDTRTGPQPNSNSMPSGTGIPVIVTNPLTDPVPTISPPGTLAKKDNTSKIKKKILNRRSKKKQKKSIEEEFEDMNP